MRLNLNGALDDIDFQYLIYSLISVFNLFYSSLNINFISHQSQNQSQNLRSNERRFNILLFKLNIFLVVFRIFNFMFFLLYCHSQVPSPVLVLPTISKRLNVASVWMPTFRDVRMWHKKLENNYLTREFNLEYQIERRWKRMDRSWWNYVTIWCYTMGDLKWISFDFGEIWRTLSVIILRSEIASVRLVTPHFTRRSVNGLLCGPAACSEFSINLIQSPLGTVLSINWERTNNLSVFIDCKCGFTKRLNIIDIICVNRYVKRTHHVYVLHSVFSYRHAMSTYIRW